jgi:hypothetical protein
MLAAAPVQVGEAEPEAPPEVLVAAGVEVPAGAEPEAAGVEAAAEEEELPLPVAVAEAELEEELPVEELLELELEEELELAEEEEEVSIGGTEMGWPAEEHCWTTALETAGWDVSIDARGRVG